MRSDVPLAAGVIAETVGINRSTTRRSINTLIHRPSSTSCRPSTVRQFTSELWNASASLPRSAAGCRVHGAILAKALLAASSDFAISLTSPSALFTLERVIAAGPRLVEIARQLSTSLGWEPENGSMRR
jgi:DNA-binding IclR family transcriptional regulator